MEQFDEQNIPEAYKPISAWGFVGWTLLFNLPLAGWIIVIVMACGVSAKKNVTNFARSYLLMWLIGFIIGLVFFALSFIFGIGMAGLSFDSLSSMY